MPDDAAVVVVPGPRTDFLAPETDALHAYLGRGGKLLAMLNPPFPEKTQPDSLKKLLAGYGFTLDDDVVIELNPVGQLLGTGAMVPIVQQYEPHPITRDMTNLMTGFPVTRSVGAAKTLPAGVTVQPLAKTTPDSWGETDLTALAQRQVKPDPEDPKGPLTLAAVATKAASSSTAPPPWRRTSSSTSRATATSSSTASRGSPRRRTRFPSGRERRSSRPSSSPRNRDSSSSGSPWSSCRRWRW